MIDVLVAPRPQGRGRRQCRGADIQPPLCLEHDRRSGSGWRRRRDLGAGRRVRDAGLQYETEDDRRSRFRGRRRVKAEERQEGEPIFVGRLVEALQDRLDEVCKDLLDRRTRRIDRRIPLRQVARTPRAKFRDERHLVTVVEHRSADGTHCADPSMR